MRNFILAIGLVQFLFLPFGIYSETKSGLYLSDEMKTENGFLFLGVAIGKEKDKYVFLAQELRYHNQIGWEEFLYSGIASDELGGWTLVPDSCQIRASKEFEKKKGLLRRFDCEHLRFALQTDASGHLLNSSLAGTFKDLPLPVFLADVSSEPIGISFPLPNGKEEGIWGFHLNGFGNQSPLQVWDRESGLWKPWKGRIQESEASKPSIYRWKRTFSN
ncbi:hypothetical protein [Leptospira ilyithenensis]|uniref:Uncharacterized protein n=1 Tax=Leptospira ilyithenensis TaxID=2484901 RepID=A0A4R9LV59_9LEPT|nr:hypothetical protein [Leptospira ilyithenensis]TGN14694.1 hypothetical protein EHS11_01520 [Leptospira ilyithenensis]